VEAVAVGLHEGAEEVKKPKESEPLTVHRRPVKSPRVRFIGQVEVDQGDHAMLVLEMSAEEAVGLASEQHQPDMWPVISERLKREVTRR
jgi:hypothetical protein